MLVTCVDVDLDMETAHASLEYQSVMTDVYWLPRMFYGNGPNKSIAMKSRAVNAGKS